MSSRSKLLCLSLLVFVACAGSTSSWADVITNGDFNTPAWSPVTQGSGEWMFGGQYGYNPTNIAGWSFVNYAGIQQNGSAWGFSPAPNGLGQTAFLQTYGASALPSISQDVTGLTAGDPYALSFYLSQRPGYGLLSVSVSVGGSTLFDAVPAGDWTDYTEKFVATGSDETLTFSGDWMGDFGDDDSGVADVSLNATPEPTPLFLLGSGLLALALLGRRMATNERGN